MRALVFDGTTVRLERRRASAGAGDGSECVGVEALIRPSRLGVSALDLEASSAGSEFRGVLGHECVGVVERVLATAGAEADAAGKAKALVGKRVVVWPMVWCGECDLCRRGLAAHCRRGAALGLRGRDGCFADEVRAPAACCIPAPTGVDDDAAVFVSSLATAYHAARQSRAEGKSFVTVLGDGRMGLLAAQCVARTCPGVRVLGKHAGKMALCERWGVRHRHASEAGRRADQDAVIDCTGTREGLALALELVRPRGRVVLLSRLAEAGGLDLRSAVDREVEIVGARGGSAAEALGLLSDRAVDVVSLITKRMRFDDAERALLAASEPGQIKVVMEM